MGHFLFIASSAFDASLKLDKSKPDYATRLFYAVESFWQDLGAKYATVARKFRLLRETLRKRLLEDVQQKTSLHRIATFQRPKRLFVTISITQTSHNFRISRSASQMPQILSSKIVQAR